MWRKIFFGELIGAHKPRSGSLAFYPRKRAARELATFTTFSKLVDERQVKPLNFVGFKAGMVSCAGRNEHQKSTSFGQEIMVPATVIECPPLKVFGIRAYARDRTNIFSLGDVTVERPEKHFRKKAVSFKQRHSKKKKEEKKYAGIEWLDGILGQAFDLRLLVHTQPYLCVFGKKKPEVFEVFLSGALDKKILFAKERLGKEITAADVFKEKDFVDVRAVDKGKGFAGVVKRFGVKIHRPKAKKHRYVGSISPWNPSTVMWTVARPGQLGYQSRTELNKRIFLVSGEPQKVNIENGFKKYGFVKNDFLVLSGSVPGPAKRAVSIRANVRKNTRDSFNISGLKVLGLKAEKGKKERIVEEEVKATKVILQKEQKKEHKSVDEEIAQAVKGK